MPKLQNNQPAPHLLQDIEEFLVDRQARKLSAKTLQWYRHSLKLFNDWCSSGQRPGALCLPTFATISSVTMIHHDGLRTKVAA